MKRVLVTGASGFIGRNVISPLMNLGFEVHAIASKNLSRISDLGCVVHPLDLMDKKAVHDLMRCVCPSHLLHLAWVTTPGVYWTCLENLDWLDASLHLVRNFIACGGRRLVVSGTCAEYAWNDEICIEKQSAFAPSTLYGASKRGLFLVLQSLCEQYKIDFAWGYVFFLYGSHENPKRFVPTVIRGLLGNDMVPCSEGLQTRDFLHVKDVANAFACLLDSNLPGGVNIGSGNGMTLREIAMTIAEIVGGYERLCFGRITTPSNEPRSLLPDITRLSSELGWKPKYDLRKGMEETIQWWKGHLNLSHWL